MLICSRFLKLQQTIFGDTNNRHFLHSTPFYHEFSWCTAPFKKKKKGKKRSKVTSLNRRVACTANQQRRRERGQCGSTRILNVGVGEKGPFGVNSSAWRRAKTSEPRGKVIDFHWYSFSIPQMDFFFASTVSSSNWLLTIKTDGRLICVSRVNVQLISHGGAVMLLSKKQKQNKNRLCRLPCSPNSASSNPPRFGATCFPWI